MKRMLLAIAVLLLGPSMGFGQMGENDALSMGQRALRNNELTAARDFLERAYREDSKDTARILAITECCIRQQDSKRAESILSSALKLYPDIADLHLKMGVTQNLRGHFKRAQEAFLKARSLLTRESPTLATVYINLGVAMMYDEQPLEALPWLDSALVLQPRNATAYNYKGMAHYKLDDFVMAIDSFDASIDIDNRNAMSFYNRGMAYLKTRDKKQACRDFHMACKMGNTNGCKAVVLECEQE